MDFENMNRYKKVNSQYLTLLSAMRWDEIAGSVATRDYQKDELI